MEINIYKIGFKKITLFSLVYSILLSFIYGIVYFCEYSIFTWKIIVGIPIWFIIIMVIICFVFIAKPLNKVPGIFVSLFTSNTKTIKSVANFQEILV